ncbi:hypothetical protein [Bacteroides acidifaciens]|uniref:hypothetical protein n=1 Tax=Bacteroides acidifaciens TaxID=85831 RepID=UPI00263B8874|nr:hypothetical protein [Bacteroides acidifaciens]
MSRRKVVQSEPRTPGTRRQELLIATKTLNVLASDVLTKGEEMVENSRVVTGAEENCKDLADCYIELSRDISRIVSKINKFTAKFMEELEDMDKK